MQTCENCRREFDGQLYFGWCRDCAKKDRDQPAAYCNLETRFTAWLTHYNQLMGINGPLSAEGKRKQRRWAWVDFVDNYLLVEEQPQP